MKHTQYVGLLLNTYIAVKRPPVKMEYVSRIMIFGLKMIVKSGLEKIILKFLYAQNYFNELSTLHKSTIFLIK